jgi:hypothetical protein
MKNGSQPLGPRGLYCQGIENALQIKINDGGLKLSSKLDGFDEKFIARIVDNKLVLADKDLHVYDSDRYFEIFDEYYIPVLQIELDKKENKITVAGAFHTPKSYTVLGDSFSHKDFQKPKLLMTQPERGSLLNKFLEIARNSLKPIHE